MPLHKRSSPKVFSKNVEEMMNAGHPQKQALAAAYAMKRRSRKMNRGGKVADDTNMSNQQEQALRNMESLRMKSMPASAKNSDRISSVRGQKHYADGGMTSSRENYEHLSGMNADDEDLDMSATSRMDEANAQREMHRATEPRHPQMRDQEVNSREEQRKQEASQHQMNNEWEGSKVYEADGGMIDEMNEKLHPMHNPKHLVAKAIEKRATRELEPQMYDEGGMVEHEEIADDLANKFVHDSPEEEAHGSNLHPFEKEAPASSMEHKAFRRAMIRKILSGR